jgi:glycolate oxidase iron-sulfur subunit
VTDPAARIQALADQCVLCGLCLPHCPTYAVARVESESPRGRIVLARALAQGQLDAAAPDDWQGLDHCLGCRRCESVCPANVEFGELLVQARRLQRDHQPASQRQRLLEWASARPRLLGLLLGGLRLARPLLPRRWRRQVPVVPAAAALAGVHRATGSRRGTVALFLGCFARRLDVPVHMAAIKVLTRLGWDVRVPEQQACCGALHRHAGAAPAEQALQRRNAAAFDGIELDAILISASGCFDSLRKALAGHPAPVRELLAFIASDASLPTLSLRAREQRVALHTACTQITVVRAPNAAASVLGVIPHLELEALPGHGCCGAAGAHMLSHPDRAATLRQPLLDQFAASGAAELCSANIGCRLHLQAGLDPSGEIVKVRHPIELLAEALQ